MAVSVGDDNSLSGRAFFCPSITTFNKKAASSSVVRARADRQVCAGGIRRNHRRPSLPPERRAAAISIQHHQTAWIIKVVAVPAYCPDGQVPPPKGIAALSADGRWAGRRKCRVYHAVMADLFLPPATDPQPFKGLRVLYLKDEAVIAMNVAETMHELGCRRWADAEAAPDRWARQLGPRGIARSLQSAPAGWRRAARLAPWDRMAAGLRSRDE